MSLGYATPETEIRALLEPGETVLWAGQPKPGFSFSWLDIPGLIFGLVFSSFAIFWITMALQGVSKSKNPGPPFFLFPLFGLPFLLIGLYVAFGRLLLANARRKHIFYVLTDRRALIRSGKRTITTRILPLATLQDFTLRERPDGTGDIIFGNSSTHLARTSPNQPLANAIPLPLIFERIENPQAIARKINEAQSALQSKSP
jgi:hypothetical protein